MVKDCWWLRIMGIGASTNVKEIRIDQKDAKWESYPSSAGSQRGSKTRGLGLGRRWINSAESAANNRRLQQLNAALEAAEKRAQDSEQRVRQLERELATLELRNMELADEATWLRKQLSDRPEVPLVQRPEHLKGATAGDPSEAYRTRQAQYLAKLESQIKLYEEDILKLKTKINKETQRLQAELEDQKHRSDKEIRSLDNRLIEAHKLNQKYEEVISSKISTETVAQLRNEVVADSSLATCASTVRAAATASASSAGDGLSQSKSRAQLILELTEQISTQQDKIRHLEDEIIQRDIDLARMKVVVQKSEDMVGMSTSRSNAPMTNRPPTVRTVSTSSSRMAVQPEQHVTPIVANEDEIEALLNNPAMLYGQDETDDESERPPEKCPKEDKDPPVNLSVSQDLQHIMSASLCSVPTSWRKDPSALPPKRLISVVNTVDGNNLGGTIGPNRPKTMCAGRQRAAHSPKRQQTMDETTNPDRSDDQSIRPIRQASAESVVNPRIHSAPMFSFKPRPSSKQSKSTTRTPLSSATSITGHAHSPIDLEEETRQEQAKKASSVPATRDGKKKPKTPSEHRKNSDAIEILSLHDQDQDTTENDGSVPTKGGYDSSNAEGDIEDGDGDDDDDDNSDQEIRRRFEERWKKPDLDPDSQNPHPNPNPDPDDPDPPKRPIHPRPPAGGGVGQASNPDHKQRITTSAKSQDSGFLGDSCASTNSLSLWKGRNKRKGKNSGMEGYDPLDVDKLLEM